MSFRTDDNLQRYEFVRFHLDNVIEQPANNQSQKKMGYRFTINDRSTFFDFFNGYFEVTKELQKRADGTGYAQADRITMINGSQSLIRHGNKDTVASTGLDMFVHHGIPWLGKKAVEMGRYYGSEALRNPKLQKKAIDYTLDKPNLMIQNVGSQALLSTKIRPNKKYKTDRKDLDGGSLDIHKLTGKHPRPKAGFTPIKYKYMGPYNPLEKQLEYDKNTGEVTKWYVQPYNKVDEIAAHHDICYDMGKNKGECDKKMVKSLDEIPYGKMPKWGQTARFLIDAKWRLGLGLSNQRKTKNGKGRRVKKKTGKKN